MQIVNWTDEQMVAAVLRRDNLLLERYYHDCKAYFLHHAAAVFVTEAHIDDIFQEALVHLWREIESHRIEMHEGRVCRWAEGQLLPMQSSLLTFLMAIAKRKHWELLRKQQRMLLTDNDRMLEVLDSDRYAEPTDAISERDQRERIVADVVLGMSPRCRQILTLFYYEHRTLDDILALRPENQTKQGLKTSKYKCMQRLREQIRERFHQLHLNP